MSHKPKRLFDLLLQGRIYHSDSVVLYRDRSYSIGKVDSSKQIVDIIPIDQLAGRAEKLESFLIHGMSFKRSDAMLMIREMQQKLIERRGVDNAFRYDRSERNMLYAAALIAAQEPETAILYFPDNKRIVDQALRIIITSDSNVVSGWIDSDMHTRGVHIGANRTLVIAHPQDKNRSYITVHELVHAFDRYEDYISSRLPDGIFERTTERIKWLKATAEAWETDTLDKAQREFIDGWKERMSHLPQRNSGIEGLGPYTDDECRLTFTGIINHMSKLNYLSAKAYPTSEARRKELMPVYEEQVARVASSRLNADDAGRKLIEYALPELGAFVKNEYLSLLNKRYQQAVKAENYLRDESGMDIVKPPRPIRSAMIVITGRAEKDRGLSDEERSEINQLRMDLKTVITRTVNLGPQPHMQSEEDRIFREIKIFYKKKHDDKKAEDLAFEEITAVQNAISQGADRARI